MLNSTPASTGAGGGGGRSCSCAVTARTTARVAAGALRGGGTGPDHRAGLSLRAPVALPVRAAPTTVGGAEKREGGGGGGARGRGRGGAQGARARAVGAAGCAASAAPGQLVLALSLGSEVK